METFQVKFKTEPDPNHKGGIIMRFERVGDITNQPVPLRVVYEDQTKLHGAFLKAGLYLHTVSQADAGFSVMPDPEQNYEVSPQMIKDLGFEF